MHKNCPLENESASPNSNIQEAEIVGEVVRAIPRIYGALEDHQVDHQATMVEVAGNISEQSVSILTDLGSTHS